MEMKPAGEGVTHISLFRGTLLMHEPFSEVRVQKRYNVITGPSSRISDCCNECTVKRRKIPEGLQCSFHSFYWIYFWATSVWKSQARCQVCGSTGNPHPCWFLWDFHKWYSTLLVLPIPLELYNRFQHVSGSEKCCLWSELAVGALKAASQPCHGTAACEHPGHQHQRKMLCVKPAEHFPPPAWSWFDILLFLRMFQATVSTRRGCWACLQNKPEACHNQDHREGTRTLLS